MPDTSPEQPASPAAEPSAAPAETKPTPRPKTPARPSVPPSASIPPPSAVVQPFESGGPLNEPDPSSAAGRPREIKLVVAVLAVVLVLFLGGDYYLWQSGQLKLGSTKAKSSPSAISMPSPSPLQASLGSVDTGLKALNSNLSAADTSLNDQSGSLSE